MDSSSTVPFVHLVFSKRLLLKDSEYSIFNHSSRQRWSCLPFTPSFSALDFLKIAESKSKSPRKDDRHVSHTTIMPTTTKPHHCPGKKLHALPGNCQVHAGFCKTDHKRCAEKGDGNVFFLSIEPCPLCDGKRKAEEKTATKEEREKQAQKEEVAAVAARQSAKSKGRYQMKALLQRK